MDSARSGLSRINGRTWRTLQAQVCCICRRKGGRCGPGRHGKRERLGPASEALPPRGGWRPGSSSDRRSCCCWRIARRQNPGPAEIPSVRPARSTDPVPPVRPIPFPPGPPAPVRSAVRSRPCRPVPFAPGPPGPPRNPWRRRPHRSSESRWRRRTCTSGVLVPPLNGSTGGPTRPCRCPVHNTASTRLCRACLRWRDRTRAHGRRSHRLRQPGPRAAEPRDEVPWLCWRWTRWTARPSCRPPVSLAEAFSALESLVWERSPGRYGSIIDVCFAPDSRTPQEILALYAASLGDLTPGPGPPPESPIRRPRTRRRPRQRRPRPKPTPPMRLRSPATPPPRLRRRRPRSGRRASARCRPRPS